MNEPDHEAILLVAKALAQYREPAHEDIEALGYPITERTYLRISQAIWNYHEVHRAWQAEVEAHQPRKGTTGRRSM